MKILQYHPSNFGHVRRLLRITQNAPKHGSKGRILFNQTKGHFELYESDEIDKINPHANYTNVEEAITNYKQSAPENNMKDLAQLEAQDETEEQVYDREPTVQENAESTLEVISGISKTMSQANREKMLAVIAEIFKMDVVSESDILKTMLEHSEFRKFMSILFGALGVEISYTRTSHDLNVSSGKLKFNSQAEYRFEDYKMGMVQALTILRQIAETRDQLESKDEQIQQKDRVIANLEKKVLELGGQAEALAAKAKSQRDIRPIVPIHYIITFIEDNVLKFVTLENGAKPTNDGSFPTKFLGKTKFPGKAAKFTNSEALAQTARMVKFAKNVTFTDIKELGPKELSKFFTVARVLIEKPETATVTE